jgi:riboflavin biosynthesis pyrimidine reductase
VAVEPLVTLFEDAPSDAGELPLPLAERYGGGLDLSGDLVYANAVSSLDGVVAIGNMRGAPQLLGDHNQADRFVVGLLRALADCILLGAGTLRADHGYRWSPASSHPPSAPLFALLERPDPQVIVVSASGEIDPHETALQAGGLVLTTLAGHQRLAPHGVRTFVLDSAPFSPEAILGAVRSLGHRRVLVEAGPSLLSQLVGAQLIDELFLTLSPVLAGGSGDRAGLLQAARLLPDQIRSARLRAVRQHGDHLFLRYAL